MATVDGGVSWKSQSSGVESNLGKVAFASAQVGWASGSNGLMLRTIDGGAVVIT